MRLVKTLLGNADSCPPIWLMRQAGRYLPEYQEIRQKLPTFMELCFHEEYATQVTLQPLQRFDLDAAILFSDILVIPHILGQTVHFVEKQGPVLSPIESTAFFDKAKDINIQEALSIPLKILQNIRKIIPPSKAVIGFAGSPWTIATYMLEQGKSAHFAKILSLLESKSPLFSQTMDVLEKAIQTFLVAQIEAGADVIQIFDSWAKAVPSAHQAEWIVAPTRRIITHIQAHHPQTPIIYYGRGVSSLYPQISQGFSRVSFGVDEDVPLQVMKDKIQKIAPVQGNLSPRVLVEGGKQMRDDVAALLEVFKGTPFVFNLGHGVLPQTPPSHVADLIDLVKR